jgi:drug/metabolite transporter (DMT)-like permease
MGVLLALAGVTNLRHPPPGPWLAVVVAAGLLLCGVGSLLISRHYRENYGIVVPTRARRMRNAAAIVAWAAVLFVGANKYLLWSPDSSVCVFAAAFAAATMVYYAILVGLREHHLVIWVTVFVVGLLPVWGDLGEDRDAIAMFPLGAALLLCGLFDQRALARAFAAITGTDHPDSDARRHPAASQRLAGHTDGGATMETEGVTDSGRDPAAHRDTSTGTGTEMDADDDGGR